MDLTVREAARLLDVSDKDVYHWIREGSFPATRLHDQYRINRVELLEWATARRVKVSPDLFQESADPNGELTLAQAIRSGGVHHGVPGTDKPSVLRAVTDRLHLPEGMDRDYFFQLFMAREALSSTGVGNGIALPHARNPVVLHLSQPSVTVSFLEQTVDFGAVDGKPVHVLFTLLSPTTRLHLLILSRLSFLLRDADFVKLLEKQVDQETLVQRVAHLEASLLPAASAATHG
jgi:PTS system nitrogen regulatory IIA component